MTNSDGFVDASHQNNWRATVQRLGFGACNAKQEAAGARDISGPQQRDFVACPTILLATANSLEGMNGNSAKCLQALGCQAKEGQA